MFVLDPPSNRTRTRSLLIGTVTSMQHCRQLFLPSSISMAQSKVNAILKWPMPRNVKQVQSFLGFAIFYHHFIFNYSDIVVPLMHLTHKGSSWDWNTKADSTFQSLKESFMQAPVLTHWSPDYPMLIETNASDYALAGIISTLMPDGEIHPIAFHS